MNPRQWRVLILGILIVLLMGLFPPMNRVHTLQIMNAAGEVEDVQESKAEFVGYRYYFSLQNRQDGQEFRVAKFILGAQLLCFVVVVRVLMVSFRASRPGLPRGKLFQRPENLPYD